MITKAQLAEQMADFRRQMDARKPAVAVTSTVSTPPADKDDPGLKRGMALLASRQPQPVTAERLEQAA
jgi:hypothetical protein